MHLSSLLVSASVLLCQAFAAKKPAAQRFEEFQLLSKQSSPLVLNTATYDSLTAAPRNHSVAVLLTALEARYGCSLCQELQPEWDILGKSWVRGDPAGESRHLFGTLDFSVGRDTFMAVRLERDWRTDWISDEQHADKRPHVAWLADRACLDAVPAYSGPLRGRLP